MSSPLTFETSEDTRLLIQPLLKAEPGELLTYGKGREGCQTTKCR
jgi:hypothetical protein